MTDASWIPPLRLIPVLAEPCSYCAAWIGPHFHTLRDEWDLGVIVMRFDQGNRLLATGDAVIVEVDPAEDKQ